MDIFLLIIAFVFLSAGLIGSLLPVLPGPPLGWVGLLILSFTEYGDFSFQFLLWMAIIAAIITALDYFIPIWGTKKLGGTKAGIRGSTIGLIIGLFFGPIGIILGPVFGAFIGEMMHQNDTKRAFRSAIGSFVGFLVGTGLKFIYGVLAFYYTVVSIF